MPPLRAGGSEAIKMTDDVIDEFSEHVRRAISDRLKYSRVGVIQNNSFVVSYKGRLFRVKVDAGSNL